MAHGRKMTIGEIAEGYRERPMPTVGEDEGFDSIVRAIGRHRHSRVLYVVDRDMKPVGIITLGCIVKHVFHHRLDEHVAPRHVMSVLTGETAADIMEGLVDAAGMDEPASDVLKRMIDLGLEEIPVVDDRGRLVGDLTLIDLLEAVA